MVTYICGCRWLLICFQLLHGSSLRNWNLHVSNRIVLFIFSPVSDVTVAIFCYSAMCILIPVSIISAIETIESEAWLRRDIYESLFDVWKKEYYTVLHLPGHWSPYIHLSLEICLKLLLPVRRAHCEFGLLFNSHLVSVRHYHYFLQITLISFSTE